jgi:hypothetical protein
VWRASVTRKTQGHGDVVVLLVVAPRDEEGWGYEEQQRSSNDRARASLRTEGVEAEAPSYRTAKLSDTSLETRTHVMCIAREECPSMSGNTEYDGKPGAARRRATRRKGHKIGIRRQSIHSLHVHYKTGSPIGRSMWIQCFVCLGMVFTTLM